DYLAAGGASTTLNLGTGVGSSVLDILVRTANEAGHEVPFEMVERRVGDPAVVFADPSAAERVLGWTSKLTLDDIIQSAYAWHASQVSN
ncbi:MAG: UDP-glucose 4-epimerase GalE, partial [Actinomycetota bacterium]|nr:UDP-glucose 4-epimerase GalE [Actinomycetota bacterium]